MRIVYYRDFLKLVEKLPSHVKEMRDIQLNVLARDPFYPTLHTKRLKGDLNKLFSFRATKDWRVLFEFKNEETIRLISVEHRKDIYR